jgi:hypothetical protein
MARPAVVLGTGTGEDTSRIWHKTEQEDWMVGIRQIALIQVAAIRR